jgi:GTP-binding protein
MVKSADIVLLVTEADKPLVKQDSYLAGVLKDSGTGIIIVANKWDLISEKDNKIDTQIIRYYGQNFPYLAFAPIIFVSAKTGRNVDKILDLILQVQQERQKEIPEEDLNVILKKLVKHHYPAQAKGQKRPHLYSLKQTRNSPPEFTVLVGDKQSIHFSYLRFIENQIRHNFGFSGVPVIIRVKTLKR